MRPGLDANHSLRPTVPTAIVLFKLARRSILFANAHAYSLLSIRQGGVYELLMQLVEEFGPIFTDPELGTKGEIHGQWRASNGAQLNYILYPIDASDGLLVFRDEAHMLQVQKERLMHNRLEIIGRLSSLVSNEILTPMQAIIGELQRVLEQLPDEQRDPRHKLREVIKNVNQIAYRGAKLYDFSRHLDVHPAAVQMLELMAFVEVMLMENPLSSNREIDVHLQPEDMTLHGDFHLLAQAILNLIEHGLRHHAPNAERVGIRAVRENGRTSLSLQFRPAATSALCDHQTRPDERLEMADWILRSHKAALHHDAWLSELIRIEFEG